MKTQFDLARISEARKVPNIRIVEGRGGAPSVCYVFFSGNGLYSNSDDDLERRIFRDDRYEWMSLCPPGASFQRAIFVRDVLKTWYVDGTGLEADSIESLARSLAPHVSGYDRLVCVGNSAGGYAAMLFGCLLGASEAWSFSGYVDLWKESKDPLNPSLAAAALDPGKREWLDIRNLLITRNGTKIVHFAPVHAEIDKEQLVYISGIPGVSLIRLDSRIHGDCLESWLHPLLLSRGFGPVEAFARTFHDRVLGKREFSESYLGGRWHLRWFRAVAECRKWVRKADRFLTRHEGFRGMETRKGSLHGESGRI